MYFKNCCILVYLFFAAGEAECSVGDILVFFYILQLYTAIVHECFNVIHSRAATYSFNM